MARLRALVDPRARVAPLTTLVGVALASTMAWLLAGIGAQVAEGTPAVVPPVAPSDAPDAVAAVHARPVVDAPPPHATSSTPPPPAPRPVVHPARPRAAGPAPVAAPPAPAPWGACAEDEGWLVVPADDVPAPGAAMLVGVPKTMVSNPGPFPTWSCTITTGTRLRVRDAAIALRDRRAGVPVRVER